MGFVALLYGFVAYVCFVVSFSYTVAFVGGFVVPKTVDSGAAGAPGAALAVNVALFALFAVQHSVMARKGFKRWWTTIVPPALERSTFVLFASAVLALLLWQWQPIPEPVIWRVDNPLAVQALWTVFALGWVIALLSSFLINHFELFGLRQAFVRFTGRQIPESEFRTPFLYRYVRHPLYLGIVLGVWSAPVMSAGHLLFAAGATGYILVGIWFEERDLIAQFGDKYRAYRAQVGMLLPGRKSQ
jgi:protein-S-isoprenylcysteine O-methyltransferase Ste14